MSERHTSASLLVTTSELHMGFITAAFGCQPDRMVDMTGAEPFGNDQNEAPENLWGLNSPLPNTSRAIEHVEWFCRLLESRRDSLEVIKNRVSYILGCDVTSSRPHDGSELTPSAMRLLAEFEVHVCVSVTRIEAVPGDITSPP